MVQHNCTTVVVTTSSSTGGSSLGIWELPEILIYLVAQFVSPPTKRSSFVCHKLAVLCKSAYRSILVTKTKTKDNDDDDESGSMELWDLILRGDYGIEKNKYEGRSRSSKRLKRSPAQKVKEAHKLMILNTEIAYSMIWELGYTSSSKKKNALTKQKMVQILNEYGPNLMMNRTMASGGNFLVEICRCRNSSANNILLCVQELVRRGAIEVNNSTNESVSSSVTALCVASVRGMPKVVKYLLSINDGSDSHLGSHSHCSAVHIKCSGRFRLHTNPKKTVQCINSTPLEFSEKMMNAEREAGATSQDLKDLDHCIKLLKGE